MAVFLICGILLILGGLGVAVVGVVSAVLNGTTAYLFGVLVVILGGFFVWVGVYTLKLNSVLRVSNTLCPGDRVTATVIALSADEPTRLVCEYTDYKGIRHEFYSQPIDADLENLSIGDKTKVTVAYIRK